MQIVAVWNRAAAWLSDHGARLRFCLRVTVAAVSAYALAQVFTIPLHGLWAVLTAVLVTEMSVGGSMRAAAEYVVGTLGGAIYASVVGLIVPHTTVLAMTGALALTVAPLAYAAALMPTFRVAPFTGVMVLLISSQLGEGPLESGLYRILEVALGGTVGVMVSMFVVPERAHGLGLNAAARILDELARVLPELLAGFTRRVDTIELTRIQNEIGHAVASFHDIAAEARRERAVNLAAEPDPTPLSRTLIRLRHDFVIIGRAAVEPLPQVFAERLVAPLALIDSSASDYLHAAARALTSKRSPPALKSVEVALETYASEIAALRNEGLTRALSSSELERLFALGFALKLLRRNLGDLGRCVQEWALHAGSGETR